MLESANSLVCCIYTCYPRTVMIMMTDDRPKSSRGEEIEDLVVG
jgi:hypothetical protein